MEFCFSKNIYIFVYFLILKIQNFISITKIFSLLENNVFLHMTLNCECRKNLQANGIAILLLTKLYTIYVMQKFKSVV